MKYVSGDSQKNQEGWSQAVIPNQLWYKIFRVGKEYSQKSAFVDPARQEGHGTEISRWQSERRNLPSFFSTSFVPVCTQVVQIFPQSCSKFSNSSAVLRNPGRRKSEGVRNKFGAALAASRKIQNSFPFFFFLFPVWGIFGFYIGFFLEFTANFGVETKLGFMVTSRL